MKPEDFLRFVEIEPFPRLWSNLNLGDQELQALQVEIMADPLGHPVISGSNGLRKLRFSKSGINKGKRDSFRVYYVYFDAYGIVLLMAAIAKNDKADLSKTDLHALAAVIERVKKLLDKGVIR